MTDRPDEDPVARTDAPTPAPGRRSVLGATSRVVTGTAAAFGLAIAAALLAVVFAGIEQWASPPPWVDNVVPYLILVVGLALAGRVAADVAGTLGVWCGLGAGLLTLACGTAVSRSSEAHGDGLEMASVVIAAVVVTVVIGGVAAATGRARRARAR